MSSLSAEDELKEKKIQAKATETEVAVSSSSNAKQPSKKQLTEDLRTASASPSPETVKQSGLRILLQAERELNPHSYIIPNEESKIAAASQSLPFVVPAQFSSHQAWSEQTAKWCYDVLDHLQLPREIVYLAMNLLERALLAPEGTSNNATASLPSITNKHEYEKMAIASLFLAVRLVSTRQNKASKTVSPPPRRKLQISELLTISGSALTVDAIQQCSSKILRLLGLFDNTVSGDSAKSWNYSLHQALVQATPHSFCKLLFYGFHRNDPSLKEADAVLPRLLRLEWLELALYLIELSVCDGGFHRLLPSVIALASLQTASKILQSQQNASTQTAFQTTQQVMEETLRKAYGISQLPNTTFVGNRLEFIYQQSQDSCRGRRANNKSRSSNNKSSRASAFTCPTLIMDEEDEEETQSDHASEALQIQAASETAAAARQDSHPMRHIQSDLDLEALGRHNQAMQHRPISPCIFEDKNNNKK